MTFCTNYSNSSYGITMGAAIILNRGGRHTKVDCHANYANCEMLAVLIPLQIFVLSAVQSFSKNGVVFLQEKAKNVLFHVPLLFFCTQLYMAFSLSCRIFITER